MSTVPGIELRPCSMKRVRYSREVGRTVFSWEVLSTVIGDGRRRVSLSSGPGCCPLDYVLSGGIACSDFLGWGMLVRRHW